MERETTPPQAAPAAGPSVPPTARHVLAVAFVAFFALFFGLGSRTLENRDYFRFAAIGREIVETGDWVVPHQNGQLYVQKPPLHLWGIACACKLLGANAWSARLPGALYGVAGVLLAFALGRRLAGGSDVGLTAALSLVSMFGYFWCARGTRMDVPQAVLFALSLYLFYEGCEAPHPRARALLCAGFWLATGVGFLIKGPVILLNLLVVATYAVVRARAGHTPRTPLGWLAAMCPMVLVPVLPWVIALASHPSFDDYVRLFWAQPHMNRDEGFWYYFPELPAKLFPSTPFFVLGLWGYVRLRRRGGVPRGLDFAVCWISAVMLALQVAGTKSNRYLIPMLFPCAVLCAWAAVEVLARAPRWVRCTFAWFDHGLRIGAAGALVGLPVLAAYLGVGLAVPLVTATVLGLALAVLWRLRPGAAVGAFTSAVVLFLSIDASYALNNDARSPYLHIVDTLRREGVALEGFGIARAIAKSEEEIGFYFAKRPMHVDGVDALLADRAVRAVLMPREEAEARFGACAPPQRGRLLPMPKGFALYVKSPPETPPGAGI